NGSPAGRSWAEARAARSMAAIVRMGGTPDPGVLLLEARRRAAGPSDTECTAGGGVAVLVVDRRAGTDPRVDRGARRASALTVSGHEGCGDRRRVHRGQPRVVSGAAEAPQDPVLDRARGDREVGGTLLHDRRAERRRDRGAEELRRPVVPPGRVPPRSGRRADQRERGADEGAAPVA